MKYLFLVLISVMLVLTGAAQTTKTYYTCVMHPEVKMDKPGKCPKCGMTLVKKTVKVAAPQTSSAKGGSKATTTAAGANRRKGANGHEHTWA